MVLVSKINDVLDSALVRISDKLPSQWAEDNIVMQGNMPGPLRYEKTPYCREIIDCLAPDSPVSDIAVMGAAQWGKTAGIIVPAIGYIIENCPGPIIMTVGHEDLIEEAMGKIDDMLNTTDLKKLIKSQSMRAKNQKSGDTNRMKEFPQGYLKLSSASNPKIWRQAAYKYGLIDDFDAVKRGTKMAGNTRDLIEKRFTSYSSSKKILYVSSPELAINSNILEVYNYGDQRKFKIPCPCCGTYIELMWSIKNGNIDGGICWDLDEDGYLIESSVGYRCQSCGDIFKDNNKSDYIQKGYWEPTCRPKRPSFRSYYMNSLYSPAGMDDWKHYVYKWLEIHEHDVRHEEKYKTFLNTTLGLPYFEAGEIPSSKELQKNVSNYAIGVVPEKLSIDHGNGRIVMLTCGVDLNGLENDARLDFEIVAWSENESNYSIIHGSIGTYLRGDLKNNSNPHRKIYSYDPRKSNNVWTELTKVLRLGFKVDTGRTMGISATAIDSGKQTKHVYDFIKHCGNHFVFAIKGDGKGDYTRQTSARYYKEGKEIDTPTGKKLYLIRVGVVKDLLAELMKLKYDKITDESQPYGYMNFPFSERGLYQYGNFFAHYESEERRPVISKEDQTLIYRWEKRKSNLENHFWDVRVYNMFVKDLYTELICKHSGLKEYSWNNLLTIMQSQKRK